MPLNENNYHLGVNLNLSNTVRRVYLNNAVEKKCFGTKNYQFKTNAGSLNTLVGLFFWGYSPKSDKSSYSETNGMTLVNFESRK